MKIVLIVFAGSGAGGVLRYFIQKFFIDAGFVQFPAGTFVVNIAGCFLIGLFEALAAKNNLISPEWRLALTTGLCGGFTTFSTFANENINLLHNGDYLYFSIYLILSIVLGLGAVVFGNYVVSFF
jgi:fluoride exporter